MPEENKHYPGIDGKLLACWDDNLKIGHFTNSTNQPGTKKYQFRLRSSTNEGVGEEDALEWPCMMYAVAIMYDFK